MCVCVYRAIAAAARHLWPRAPSGLLWLQTVPLGSQEVRHRQSPPSLDGLTYTVLHLSCTAKVIHSNLIGAVRTAFISPPSFPAFLSSSPTGFFFSGWLVDRCPSAPVFTATPAQLQAPQHNKNALLNETLRYKRTPSFSGCQDVNGV